MLILESGPSVQAKVLTVSLISSLASCTWNLCLFSIFYTTYIVGQEASIYFDGERVFPCCVNLMKSSPAYSLAGPLFILFHKLSELPLQNKDLVFMDDNFASLLELFGNLEGTSCSESRAHLSIGLANCCQTPSAQKKLYNSPIKDYIANMLFSDVPKVILIFFNYDLYLCSIASRSSSWFFQYFNTGK